MKEKLFGETAQPYYTIVKKADNWFVHDVLCKYTLNNIFRVFFLVKLEK